MLRSRRSHVVLDVVLALWAAVWIAVGLSVASEVRGLTRLSRTVESVGRAVTEVGMTLRALEGLPVVGDGLSDPAQTVEEAGRSAVASARESRDSAGRVAALLGISIVLIPTLPVLVLYVPERIVFERDRRAVRRALAKGGGPALDDALALRALATLPTHSLLDVSEAPGADFADGRHAALADAELARLGLRRPVRATSR